MTYTSTKEDPEGTRLVLPDRDEVKQQISRRLLRNKDTDLSQLHWRVRTSASPCFARINDADNTEDAHVSLTEFKGKAN